MSTEQVRNIKEKAVRAALELAASGGWSELSLSDVAEAAGIGLPELHDCFEDKDDILAALGRMIDRRVLENAGPGASAEGSARERLFDLLMERFEIMNEYRPGLTAILRDFKYDPKQAVIAMPHLCRSMSWMLEAAGISTVGLSGALRVAGLSAVYLNGLRVWQEDETPDLSKTMAALDKNLGRAESWAERLGL